MLIEKAYAKVYGTYSALQFGYTNHSLMNLTGFPTVNHDLPTPDEIDEGSPEVVKVLEKLWRILGESNAKGYLIAGETPGEDNMTAKGEKSGAGIVPGHAYSILKCVTTSTKD